jgi:hypothetical protein
MSEYMWGVRRGKIAARTARLFAPPKTRSEP